jgi:hypothetical protein
VASAVIVIIICLTGLLLNHTDDLQLGRHKLQADWLLDWYGIEAPAAKAYGLGNAQAIQLGRRVFIDGSAIPGEFDELKGTVAHDAGLYIATSTTLTLLSPEYEFIETLGPMHGLPEGIERLGLTTEDRLAVDTSAALWLADPALLNWKRHAQLPAQWSQATTPDDDQLAKAQALYRGTSLSLERFILDLHSGRIFGGAGKMLADAAAVAFILLAMTGIWMWLRTRRRKS